MPDCFTPSSAIDYWVTLSKMPFVSVSSVIKEGIELLSLFYKYRWLKNLQSGIGHYYYIVASSAQCKGTITRQKCWIIICFIFFATPIFTAFLFLYFCLSYHQKCIPSKPGSSGTHPFFENENNLTGRIKSTPENKLLQDEHRHISLLFAPAIFLPSYLAS